MKTTRGKKTIVFYILTGIYWFSIYTYSSVIPNHASSLGADAAMVGLISGSYGLAQMILRLPLGILSDLIKKRKVFIGIGLAFSIISGTGLGLATTPMQMLIFRTIAGISVSTYIVFPGYITETYTHLDNSTAIGNMTASARIGRTAAILTGGLIAQLFGVKWAFFIGGIAATICMIPYLILPGDNYSKEHKKYKLRELLSVIKSKDLLFSSIITIFFQFATFAAIYTFTPMLAKEIGMNEVGIGLLTAIFTFSGSFSSVISGSYLRKKLGIERLAAIAFMMSAFLFLLMPYIKSIALLFVLQFAVGFSMGIILPAMMSKSLNNIPTEKKGTAMGYFQSIYGIGIVGGPYLVGLVIRYGNIKKGYAVIAAICILAALMILLMGRRDKNRTLDK